MKIIKRLIILGMSLLLLSCADVNNKNLNNDIFKEAVIGETLDVNNSTSGVVYDENYNVLHEYALINPEIGITRFLDGNIKVSNKVILELKRDDEDSITQFITIEPSIQINYLCASKDCISNTGNIVEGIVNKLKITSINTSFNKIVYKITGPGEEVLTKEINFDSYTNFDETQFSMHNVPVEYSSYYGIIQIQIFKDSIMTAETIYPVRVVRPLEIKHYGKYELAEVLDPVPVTGCIPGSLGTRVNYSESVSETRQNNVTISLSKSWSNSISNNIDYGSSTGISISETENIQLSSSQTDSQTVQESETLINSNTENSYFDFSSSDGENWSWSFNEGNSSTTSSTEGNSNNTGINGSITTGTSVEGSIPILGKASGKVELSAGASYNYVSSNSETNTESTNNSKGYVSTTSSNTGKSFGSSNTISNGSSLSGSYAFSTQSSNTISEGESKTSGRIWNMSENISTGNVVSQDDQESVSETIVSSSSSTTTFNFSGYIPPNRSGIFYRQTSRYTKLSEIITYTIDGIPIHSGYLSMNTWVWAPDLALGETCENIPPSKFQSKTCYIPPCEN